MNTKLKTYLPHLGAFVLFVLISVVYFYPALQGNTLKMHDIQQHRGMSKEINDYRVETGEEVLWTNSMFSGMPATQISVRHESNILKHAFNVFTLYLPYPINILLMYMIGFYILLVCLRINPWLAVLGAVAFAFSTYFIIILEAGHRSKAYAIAFMPAVLGAVLYTYRTRKILFGSILTAFFLAIQIAQNHVQTTYYLMFVILFVVVAEMIRKQKSNELSQFFKASGFLLVAAMLSVTANMSNLWGTYEYGKETIRGANELTLNKNANQAEGLDIGYITNWCLGIEETANFIIPNAKGGKSGSAISSLEDLEDIESPSVKAAISSVYQQGGYVNSYWGEQPIVSGPHYMGAIVLFLAFLCVVLFGDLLSWSLLGVTILTVMLSWGHNFLGLTEFFVEHVPMYNKFRAVTIILIVPAMIFPLLMILFLQKLIKQKEELLPKMKNIYITSGIFIGVLVLFSILPETFFTFLSSTEMAQLPETILSQISEFRVDVFKADAFRSLLFVLVAFGLIIGFLKKWFNQKVFIVLLAVVVVVDMVSVDKRYLHNEKLESGEYEKWQPKNKLLKPFTASKGDLTIFQIEAQNNPDLVKTVNQKIQSAQQEIMLETGEQLSQEEKEAIIFEELNKATNYRVYALGNSFNESRTSYFHKSIGGYHGAKLRRYQDLIEYQISRGNMDVLNMLNMKYVLRPDNKGGYELNGGPNPQALGNAWFVENIHYAESANAEMKLLSNLYSVTSSGNLFLNSEQFKEGSVSDLDTLEIGTEINRIPLYLSELNLPLDSVVTIGKDSVNDIINESIIEPISVVKHYSFKPSKTAVMRKIRKVEESYGEFEKDETAFIRLTSYRPNHLIYDYTSSKDQFVVFSEIYYNNGWQAYIDNQPVSHERVNYVLRGMQVPPGEHTIEFKFTLKSFDLGSKIGYASSSLILLLLLGVGFKEFRTKD